MKRSSSLFAYTEKFKEVFPYYLAIGMTYEQFWDMDCELVKFYRKAAQLKQELKNQDAWIQGMYFYEALARIAPIMQPFAKKGTKAEKYISEPLPLFKKEDFKEQRKVVNAKAFMEMFALENNKKFQQKSGEIDGK